MVVDSGTGYECQPQARGLEDDPFLVPPEEGGTDGTGCDYLQTPGAKQKQGKGHNRWVRVPVVRVQMQFRVMQIPIETFELSNGLRLVLSEDHTAPIVGVNLWYHVGSANERTGRTGFAHLFEHMLFQGSA